MDLRSLQLVAAAFILAFTGYLAIYGHRHRVRVGMRAGMAGLAAWSFLMATSHGAGLMLVPSVLSLCLADQAGMAGSLSVSLAAVAVHTGAMLTVIAAIALVVFSWLGLAGLRSAWINFDRLWTLALGATGIILLVW
jgi:hypothetical protein